MLQEENAVYVYRMPGDGYPGPNDFERGGYGILKALSPPMRDRVLIKPNVIPSGDADSGLKTHPNFVGGMIDYLREAGSREIMVGEGGWNRRRGMEEIWRQSGYRRMADEKGVELVDLNLQGVTVEIPNGGFTETLTVSKLVMEEGILLVNVPKMKTHNLAVTTLCMKNLMGTVLCPERHFCGRARRRSQEETGSMERYEYYFGQLLADLSCVVKPDLCVVEGVIGRDGTGFHRGSNISTRMAIAGRNNAVVDSFTSYVMGFNPKEISCLREAACRGLGTNDLCQIKVYEVTDGQISPVEDIERFFNGTFQVISWTGKNHPHLYMEPPLEWKY